MRNQKTRRYTTNNLRNHERRNSETCLDLFEDGYRPFDRQHVRQVLSDIRCMNTPDIIESHGKYEALVDRLTVANVLRRKQFSQWERHSWKLHQYVKPRTTDSEPTFILTSKPIFGATKGLEDPKQTSVLSPTEVTKTHRESLELTGPENNIETPSTVSFATTIKDIEGHEACLPDPPRIGQDGHAFECPYCFVLCPPKEASRRRWRGVHHWAPPIVSFQLMKAKKTHSRRSPPVPLHLS